MSTNVERFKNSVAGTVIQIYLSQVARREDPDEDIAAIKEVRRKVGENIVLRVDANRKWTYDAAVKFAHGVKECCLQYIEVYGMTSFYLMSCHWFQPRKPHIPDLFAGAEGFCHVMVSGNCYTLISYFDS